MSECPYCYCDTTREYHTVNCRTNDHLKKAAADRLQAQVDRMTVELYRAREAGRREGLEEAAVLCRCLYLIEGLRLAREIRALIDSPKAEGEEPSDNYVAWLQFRKGSIRVCDSDAEGAFRVYRHPKEAEGEEPK